MILSGKDKGKRGEILAILPKKNRAVIAKVNFVKRHVKPTQKELGRIYEKEFPIHMSKVMLICPKCDRALRPKFDKLSDGKKIRICRKCGEMIV